MSRFRRRPVPAMRRHAETFGDNLKALDLWSGMGVRRRDTNVFRRNSGECEDRVSNLETPAGLPDSESSARPEQVPTPLQPL